MSNPPSHSSVGPPLPRVLPDFSTTARTSPRTLSAPDKKDTVRQCEGLKRVVLYMILVLRTENRQVFRTSVPASEAPNPAQVDVMWSSLTSDVSVAAPTPWTGLPLPLYFGGPLNT